MAQVSAADDADDEWRPPVALRRRQARGQRFGHGAVPVQLRLDEVAEAAAVTTALAMRVFAVDTEQEVAVGRAGRRRATNPFAFARRHGIPALVADRPCQARIDVEREHRQTVDAHELEKRQVERSREIPDLLPAGLHQQCRRAELAGHPAIEHRLHAARKHLEADDHLRTQRVQPGEYLQLPAVMIFVIMLLAEQDDISRGGTRQHLVGRDALAILAGDPQPARGRGAGCAACCRAGRQQRKTQGSGHQQQRKEQEPAIAVARHRLPLVNSAGTSAADGSTARYRSSLLAFNGKVKSSDRALVPPTASGASQGRCLSATLHPQRTLGARA